MEDRERAYVDYPPDHAERSNVEVLRARGTRDDSDQRTIAPDGGARRGPDAAGVARGGPEIGPEAPGDRSCARGRIEVRWAVGRARAALDPGGHAAGGERRALG